MNESDLRQLISNSTDGSSINPYSHILEPLMPMLTLLFIASIVLTVFIIVYFVISIIQKQRQHRAIMRIDDNLQKLVDNQIQNHKSQELDK